MLEVLRMKCQDICNLFYNINIYIYIYSTNEANTGNNTFWNHILGICLLILFSKQVKTFMFIVNVKKSWKRKYLDEEEKNKVAMPEVKKKKKKKF